LEDKFEVLLKRHKEAYKKARLIVKHRLHPYRHHPYLFWGVGVQPWITYSIRDGYAYIERWFGGPEFVPLERAAIKTSNTLGVKIGFGDITIVAESSAVLEWRKVKNMGAVYEALERASKGIPFEPS
jgi:hypothetical protein